MNTQALPCSTASNRLIQYWPDIKLALAVVVSMLIQPIAFWMLMSAHGIDKL